MTTGGRRGLGARRQAGAARDVLAEEEPVLVAVLDPHRVSGGGQHPGADEARPLASSATALRIASARGRIAVTIRPVYPSGAGRVANATVRPLPSRSSSRSAAAGTNPASVVGTRRSRAGRPG